jgi:hypothetical protein
VCSITIVFYEQKMKKLFDFFDVIVPIGAITYIFYMTWFRPSYFREQLPKRIKGRGPIVDYFREWYASSEWLWINRLVSLFFVLVIGFLIGGVLLHFLGVIP